MQEETQFFYCPLCKGTGRDPQKPKLVCNECGSFGVGTFIANDFLHWGYEFNVGRIVVRHSRRVFNYIVLGGSLLVGLAGALSLVWWLQQNASGNSLGIDLGQLLTFWAERDPRILTFWVGMFALLFTYFHYRWLHTRRGRVKVINRAIQDRLQKTALLPNNWQELKRYRHKIDVSNAYSEELLRVIERAYELAVKLRHPEFVPAHVVMLLLQEHGSKQETASARELKLIFNRLGIFKGKLLSKLQETFPPQRGTQPVVPRMNPLFRQALIEAYVYAFDAQLLHVTLPNLIAPLARYDDTLRQFLRELSVSTDDVHLTALWQLMAERFADDTQAKSEVFWEKMQHRMQRATNAVATPLLDHFCTNITRAAHTPSERIIIDSADNVAVVTDKLEHNIKQFIIAGPQGIGKTSLLYNLAERIANGNVAGKLINAQMLLLNRETFDRDAPQLSVEQKIFGFIAELKHAKNVVLVIDDATPEMVNAISHFPGEFIAILTMAEPPEHSALPAAQLEEPTTDVLLQILMSHALRLEKELEVYISFQVLRLTAAAAFTYLKDEALPQAAIALMEQAMHKDKQQQNKQLSTRTIAEIVAEKTGTPFTTILKEAKLES